jgi:hypothetical protein
MKLEKYGKEAIKMLLALEIGLTVAAWRRGWKAWALLPFGIGAVIAIVFGAILGASGVSIDSIMAFGIMFDLACVAALATMVAKPRWQSQCPEPEQATEATAVNVR